MNSEVYKAVVAAAAASSGSPGSQPSGVGGTPQVDESVISSVITKTPSSTTLEGAQLLSVGAVAGIAAGAAFLVGAAATFLFLWLRQKKMSKLIASKRNDELRGSNQEPTFLGHFPTASSNTNSLHFRQANQRESFPPELSRGVLSSSVEPNETTALSPSSLTVAWASSEKR